MFLSQKKKKKKKKCDIILLQHKVDGQGQESTPKGVLKGAEVKDDKC
jgi:hypothetical protein